jgi:hypothetical protein
VKVFKFAPHGNFCPVSSRSVAFLDEFCTKNEQKKVFDSKLFLELLFPSFFCMTRFDDCKPFSKKSKVSMRYKVRTVEKHQSKNTTTGTLELSIVEVVITTQELSLLLC